MARIESLIARETFDSRGDPTIEAEITTASGTVRASVPSGASVGTHEALELRDGDMNVRGGRGVGKALAHVNETIAATIVGKEFDQKSLDGYLCELDGTENKSRLGANAILAVSIAFARAQALLQERPLYAYLGAISGASSFFMPQPLFNVLNGGKHAEEGIDIQECMLAPIGPQSVSEKVAAAKKCMAALQSLLEQRGYRIDLGDEGGFAPSLKSNDEALELLTSSIAKAGYAAAQVSLALDVAASSFYKDGKYTLRAGGEAKSPTKADMLAWYAALAEKYPIISIEDGFAEDDWETWSALTKMLGAKLCIVGDDLTVTNVGRIALAAEKQAANACIIKPNQIGTVTEAIAAVHAARRAGWKVCASHRSGETADTFIADFAVGLSCDYLKAGAPTKEERLVKYNRLMEIERELLAV